MKAIREIKTVKDRKLILNLPEEFNEETVEIIVFSFEKKKIKSKAKSKLKRKISPLKFGIGKYNFKGSLDNINLRDFAHE